MKRNHFLFAKEKLILITFFLICFVLLIPSTSCKKDLLLNYINSWNDGNPNCATCGTVKDIDGNIYHTVQIGTQCWMVENLKTTHYRNGDPIPNVTDNYLWNGLSTGAYCWYNNDEATYKSVYGALYNQYAAISDNLSPIGWHVASREEWELLVDNLGGVWNASGKLKESGTKHWLYPNSGATNESGFTALPGGIRALWPDGTSFRTINTEGNWWTSTKPDANNDSFWVHLQNYIDYVGYYGGRNAANGGFSIRCIKDLSVPSK